jgi:peptidoglycan/xylan/chitin deacetylase (PgdA/CDA1 family)
MMGKRPLATIVVLYYHAVLPEQRAQFARQLETIINLAKPIPTDVADPLNTDAHYVAVTFDDGFENILENALPELEKRGVPSTLFIPTELLGQYPPWLTTAADQNRYGKLMSANQLRRLPSDLVTIGSHGMTHCLLPSLNEESAKRELSESRVKLEKLLNRKVTLFSFPYGASNQHLVQWCQEAGYERVFTSSPVVAYANPKEFETGRVWAEPTDWPLEFRLKILGAYRWLPWAFALKREVLSFKRRLWSV